MTKFTKGPWGFFLHHPENVWHIGENPMEYEKGMPYIARIGSVGNQRANAALIAAAPQLYEALEDVYENVASDSPEMWGRVLNVLMIARGGL